MIEKFYFTMRSVFILFKQTFFRYKSTFKQIFKIHHATPWGLTKTVFDNQIYFCHPLMFIIEERMKK